ncbi:hypothetical protein [Legionella cardiaca]|uniref:Substrate of the Dot/Icm secretion system n=1 Tax=Legionella cardiaca TaxID=1071983 RepID=A0ABY8ATR2_9GAMM|nr:hypothetical protein [Legionella cardiaca]WED44058.1 hypothetical protein PXX05_04530 [Legionella cardiaca]
MGKFKVSTFGKWEELRLTLVASLLKDKQITAVINESAIHTALLDPVNSAMVESAMIHVKKRSQETSPPAMRELTIESYHLSLTVMLEHLASALSISENLLAPYVEKFIQDAKASIPDIIDDMMKIGAVSVKAKAEGIEQLYGSDFKDKFKELAKQLPFEDEELINMARQKIEDLIRTKNFGANEKMVLEHFTYINEIAQQMSATADFKEQFKKETGKSMTDYKLEYKEKIKIVVTPFWKTTTEEQSTQPVAEIKLNQ